MSYGCILGELVRRVTGMTLGAYLRQEVAGRVGADVWIGLPPEQEHRVARLVPPRDPGHEGVQPVITAMTQSDSVAAKAFLGKVFPPGFLGAGTDFNSRAVHESEIPAAGGIATARGIARRYAATVAEVDGMRLLSPDTVEAARQVQSEGIPLGDGGAELRLSTGFMVNSAARRMPTAEAFGHWGFGGSVGLADPVRRIRFGYVPNQLLGGVGGDPRALRLIEEVERLTR